MKTIQEALFLVSGLKGKRRTSLQIRLFIFLSCFVFGIAMAFVLLMMVTGVFNAGEKENEHWIAGEMSHISENIYADFGRLSVNGTQCAAQLSKDIDIWLEENGMSASMIKEHPEKIEGLLSSQTPYLFSVLQSNQCSGTFLILDASMNTQNDSSDSRAGIFLKRTEPNKVNLVSSKIYFLRGPAEIARNMGIGLLGQWQMEFDVSQSDYFNKVVNTARQNNRLPSNRLYYWTDRMILKGNSESGMLFCMPLIGQDGTVYGICGFEFSSMLFKLSYSPDNSQYAEIFATLSPVQDGRLNTSSGLIAGNSYLTNQAAGEFIKKEDKSTRFAQTERFAFLNTDTGMKYIGMCQPLKLYATDSPYREDEWEIALLMPESNWKTAVIGNNGILYIAIILLLILSLFASIVMSRHYIRPVVEALEMIKTDRAGSAKKRTNIAEIDDLLEYLATQDDAVNRELEKNGQSVEISNIKTPDLSSYQEFIHNIDTLSTAERAVFNLYMRGLTASEIADTLCLSMNTIKTHNKRIYMKLNVTSRKELMVYVQMMTGDNTSIS